MTYAERETWRARRICLLPVQLLIPQSELMLNVSPHWPVVGRVLAIPGESVSARPQPSSMWVGQNRAHPGKRLWLREMGEWKMQVPRIRPRCPGCN